MKQGIVVGWSDTSIIETHAFLWQDGVMTDLGTLGGSKDDAPGVKNRGQVVGNSSLSPDPWEY
ncbi:MAG: hypothetical protein PVH59_08075 [Anaerolineae bacterium]|jgi:probable HAF family extracellular repeat protein